MLVLITYDVKTETAKGRKRLRRVAKVCESYGQRVQKSVFEVQVDRATLVRLKAALIDEIKEDEDSLRFYFLGKKGYERVEHIGVGPSWDMEGPLIL